MPVVEYKCTNNVWNAEAAGGGGGTPSGPSGSFQKNSGGAFGPANCLENGTTLNCTDDPHFRGPNLGVDITVSPFNARVVNTGGIPQTTGTITGGLGSLVVASNPGFILNDGFALVGGGGTNCGTAPLAPTVTPSLASGPTGTGNTVPGATGSTSMSYVTIALSKGGCYTAASPITTVANASNAMGANSLAITSQTNVLGTVTATVGTTANLATGTYGKIDGTTDNQEFSGRESITVTDGTHFTYQSGLSSAYWMSSTTATGGTFHYYVGNHIVLPALPAGTNMVKEIVYRCIGASCALPANAANYSPVYISYPLTGFNNSAADPTYGTWDDYGTTMTPALTPGSGIPWYAPATPPATNVNDMLIGSITNIVGTTFTVNPVATNSTTAAPIRFGIDAALLAAQAASNVFTTGGGGALHLPPPVENTGTGAFCYVTSSYLILNTVVNFGAAPCFGDTVEYVGGALNGTTEASAVRMSTPSNGIQAQITAQCRGANPCIWRKGTTFTNFRLLTTGPGTLGVFDSSGAATRADNLAITTDGGSTDYMGIPYYYYNDDSGTGQFGGVFRNFTLTTGPAQVSGSTDTPAFISKNGQQWYFDYFTGLHRGFYIEANAANTATNFTNTFHMGEEVQGPITPLLVLANTSCGNRGGVTQVAHFVNDSGVDPMIVNASICGTIGAPLYINGINSGQSNAPIISGQPWNAGISIITDKPFYSSGGNVLGVNHDVTICNGQANASLTNRYTGCLLPALNVAAATYSTNHTLTGSEGIVIETGAGTTVTASPSLPGQVWDVFNNSGGIVTLTTSTGTLHVNGATGPFVISNNLGLHVFCDGTDCYATGIGGSGSGVGTGTQNCLTDWATTSSLGSVCSNVSGQIPTAQNGAAPVFTSPSLTDSANSPVTTTPYTLACDSGTALVDRTHSLRFQSGASAVTIPLSSAAGCQGLVTTVFNDGAGTLTFTRTSADTLTVVNGSTALDAQTSFTLVSGQYATISQNATGLWLIRIAIGAVAGVNSLTGDTGLFCNVASTGAVTLVPCTTTLAHKYWGNSSGSTGTATFSVISIADLPTGIPNANLANPSTTVNSQTCTLGSTCAIGYPNIAAGALANGTTATTQAVGDSSSDVATDAFVAASLPVQSAAIHRTAQTAAISTATLCVASAGACATAGQYHVHFAFIETGTACATPGTGGVTFLLTWTDTNGTTHSAVSVGFDDASTINAVSQTFHFQTTLAAAWGSGDFNISTNGTIVQYATGYTACGVGTGTYQLDATVVRVQ